MRARSRAAAQVRVIHAVAEAQAQLAAFLSHWPHGLPNSSHQHPQGFCGGEGSLAQKTKSGGAKAAARTSQHHNEPPLPPLPGPKSASTVAQGG